MFCGVFYQSLQSISPHFQLFAFFINFEVELKQCNAMLSRDAYRTMPACVIFIFDISRILMPLDFVRLLL